VALFALLAFEIGYPFVISFALLGTASGLTFLVLLTASDAIAKDRPRDVFADRGLSRRRNAGMPRRRVGRISNSMTYWSQWTEDSTVSPALD